MPPNQTNHHPIASLFLPKSVPALITYATHVVTRMSGNPAFPAPSPSLATVNAAIADLQAAETAALTRAKGAATTRNEKRAVLATLMRHLCAYVQVTADASPDTAGSVIESAGLSLRKTPARRPSVFAAKPGDVSGSAKLVAPSAGNRAAYEWESSSDGGKTWAAAEPTTRARTTVTGLPAGTTVLFRYRAVTKTGASDWSQPLALLVK